MADFNISFDKIILAEGGYVNDPDDAGGETFLGISRKNHPKAKMWKYIDDIKLRSKNITKDINNYLKKDSEVLSEVKHIYKTNYWDNIYLDEVHSQKIAHQIFDTAVNMGITSAIRIAQQVSGMTVTGKFSQELLYNLKHYDKG